MHGQVSSEPEALYPMLEIHPALNCLSSNTSIHITRLYILQEISDLSIRLYSLATPMHLEIWFAHILNSVNATMRDVTSVTYVMLVLSGE